MSENYRSSLYSVFIFILAFSIINFYVKVAREEKKVRLEKQKLADLKNQQQQQNPATFKDPELNNEMYCRPKDPFIHLHKPSQQCYRHLKLQ